MKVLTIRCSVNVDMKLLVLAANCCSYQTLTACYRLTTKNVKRDRKMCSHYRSEFDWGLTITHNVMYLHTCAISRLL